MRVLFWGTPQFAAPALLALLGEGFDVAGVVTQPDKPVGRSRSELVPPPIKTIAIENDIPVLQPERPRGERFMLDIAELAPDLSVVVAYGHILNQEVIDRPKLGTVNIHASLLPKLRGAAPIQAAIREGFDETGVSIMRMVAALDAGPVLHQVRVPILPDETFGELSERLSEEGALALIEALMLMELDKATPVQQDEAEATYAPKIDRTMTEVDWTADARDVSRVIRAYDPKPGARTLLHGSDVKLFGGRLAPRTDDQPPGSVTAIDAEGMTVACGSGAVRVGVVQPAGKKRMSPEDWERGRGVSVGERFERESARP